MIAVMIDGPNEGQTMVVPQFVAAIDFPYRTEEVSIATYGEPNTPPLKVIKVARYLARSDLRAQPDGVVQPFSCSGIFS